MPTGDRPNGQLPDTLTLHGPPAPPVAGPAVPGYELLRELGRGGQGVVYLARHRQLHRLTALKVLRGPALVSRDALDRFRAEATAVARLRHPGIVQVYEIGEITERAGAEPQPFIALEYVAGGSLAECYREALPAPQNAARLLADLADAVQHAHERGLVHRDLKPANVLLAAADPAANDVPASDLRHLRRLQPKITDFGLAKDLDAAEGHTRSGAIFGTPAYMAPEQAAGRGRHVGPAADVYALGAILYELLTGRPPFKAASLLELLEQIEEREPVPPRQIQPAVPRDLETIALRCLHKDPARRYATAQALADDLRRHLDGRPILARPVGRAERAIRWCRRNPAVAGLLAALTAALIGGFTSIVWLWLDARAERATAQAERATALAERAKAVANFRKAREAVDQSFTVLSEDRELKGVGLERLRRRLLEAGRAFYVELAGEAGADADLQAEAARAHVRLALMTAAVARPAEAIRLYQEALARLEPLARDGPLTEEARREIGQVHLELARLHFAGGRLAEAEAAVQAACDHFRALGEAAGADLPVALVQQAEQYELTGQLREAIPALHAALGHTQTLADRQPERPAARALVALCLERLAETTLNLERMGAPIYRPLQALGESRTALEQARATFEALAAAAPDEPENQFQRARIHALLGAWLSERQQDNLADAEFAKGLALAEALARDHPAVTAYQENLGWVLAQVGRHQQQHRRPAEAVATLDRAAALLEPSLQGQPERIAFRRDLGQVYRTQGGALLALGRKPEALRRITQAAETLEGLAQRLPPTSLVRVWAAEAWEQVAVGAWDDRGHLPENTAAYQRAVAILAPLVRTPEAMSDPAQYYALLQAGLGLELIVFRGRPAEGRVCLQEAVALFAPLFTASPGDVGLAERLATVQVALVQAYRGGRLPAQADAAEAEVLATLDRLLAHLQAADAPADDRARLGDAWRLKAKLLGNLGRHADAVAALEKALATVPADQQPPLRRERLIGLGRTAAQDQVTAEAAALTATAPAPEDWVAAARALALVAARHPEAGTADQAMRMLKRARLAGAFAYEATVRQLWKDPDWQALRGRADFREVVPEPGP